MKSASEIFKDKFQEIRNSLDDGDCNLASELLDELEENLQAYLEGLHEGLKDLLNLNNNKKDG